VDGPRGRDDPQNLPGESVAQIGGGRLGVLAAREPDLGIRLAGLRLDLEDLIGAESGAGSVTLWLEGLPRGLGGTARVVDDLLRR